MPATAEKRTRPRLVPTSQAWQDYAMTSAPATQNPMHQGHSTELDEFDVVAVS